MNVMTRILVIYASTHGQTAKVAGALAETLRRCGAHVDLDEARRTARAPDAYDAVIVAASVHAGGYQKEIQRWTRTHAAALNRKPTAFVSVCLGVLQHEPQVKRELESIVGRLLEATGWEPATVKPVAGALLYTRYNWFVRRLMKRIVAKAGGDTDTSRDYEYTNWADVRAFGEEFAARAMKRTEEGRALAIA